MRANTILDTIVNTPPCSGEPTFWVRQGSLGKVGASQSWWKHLGSNCLGYGGGCGEDWGTSSRDGYYRTDFREYGDWIGDGSCCKGL